MASRAKAKRQRVPEPERVQCPSCERWLPSDFINLHLDTGCPGGAVTTATGPPRAAGKTARSAAPSNPVFPTTGARISFAPPPGSVQACTDSGDTDATAAISREPGNRQYAEAQGTVTPATGRRIGGTDSKTHVPPCSAGNANACAAEGLAQCGTADSPGYTAADARAGPLRPSLSPPGLGGALVATRRIEGQYLLSNFISVDEQRQLMDIIDAPEHPWRASSWNGRSRGKRWGVMMDVAKRTVGPAVRPMPEMFSMLAARMRAAVPVASCFRPNEANAIDYDKGRGDHLLPHVDDRQLSTNVIATLSVVGTARMTFAPAAQLQKSRQLMAQSSLRQPTDPAAPAGPRSSVPGLERLETVELERVLLPERSLQLLSCRSRYSMSHGISNEDLLTERRVSLTFRESPLSASAAASAPQGEDGHSHRESSLRKLTWWLKGEREADEGAAGQLPAG